MSNLNRISRVAGRSLNRLRFAPQKVSISTFSQRALLPSLSTRMRTIKRTMVMITQTKSSDMPKEEEEEKNVEAVISTLAESISSFNQLSDTLIVTPSCVNQVQTLIKQRQSKRGEEAANDFLRVYVDAGGCSGFQYRFEFDNEIDEDEDIVVVANEDSVARVVVDKISLDFLKGSTLDYVQEMIKSTFVIADNPQSESACGCGSSFAVKNFEANPATD
jgi:iron-sulfur cluster assembly accessory protein